MVKIYIRPLRESDADVSYLWRNDREIWTHTGSKPNRIISQNDEIAWIKEVLQRTTERRFAICIEEKNSYIGNVQLTNIDKQRAELHIFIGEKEYWGKGVGTEATSLILKYAFQVLMLEEVYLIVNKKNTKAIKMYMNCGFVNSCETEIEQHLICINNNQVVS